MEVNKLRLSFSGCLGNGLAELTLQDSALLRLCPLLRRSKLRRLLFLDHVRYFATTSALIILFHVACCIRRPYWCVGYEVCEEQQSEIGGN